ncbi:NERD domain-containing protein [Streptomyces anulatus]|uniref:nuclease-related domain-containing protein n=1 Tax=Streptomyces anulatus TaxID=1892 RepID=UPI0022589BFA|nr:nuclease-related domain-containing protein [Streptomyces anulatus]MCX4606786.1 NERD domain-containing protein [Streptomyces anulatus]
MNARNSAAAQAADMRVQARRGVWQRLLAAVGVRTGRVRRADAVAARWEHGAAGEAETARLVAVLGSQGWVIRHDLRMPGSRANLDHLLISPCGTAVVVLDSKNWHRSRTTMLVGGRVHCGTEGRDPRYDRQNEVDAVASYARRVSRALGMPGVVVWPLLVIHGSPIAGGRLEAAAPDWAGVVHVVGPARLVPTLAAAPKVHDPVRAAAVAARVDRVLLPYA